MEFGGSLMQLVTAENHENSVKGAQLEMIPMSGGDLRLLSNGDRSSIHFKNICHGSFKKGDKFSRNFLLCQLHESTGFKLKDLARVFGLQYQYVSAIFVRFKKGGVEDIKDKSGRGSGRPVLITAAIGAEILKLRKLGKTYEEISTALRFRFKKK